MKIPGNFSLSSHSLRTRLTLSLGVIAVIVFAVVGSFLYLALASELESADRDELHGKKLLVSHYIAEASADVGLDELKHHIDDAVIAHGHLRVWLLAKGGEVILGVGPIPRQVGGSGDLLSFVAADGIPLEGVSTAVESKGILPLATMIVAIDVAPRLRLLEKYRWMLWLVCGVGVLVIVGLAAWTTWRGLIPVRRLSEQAARISPASLSTRLEATGVDIELEALVQGFNSALDRVEAAYRQMESFTADVAHELRTPLATLINAAEVTLGEQRTSECLRETLADQLEELEQLKGLTVDMLFLSRADQGDQAHDAKHVVMSDEVRKTVDYFEALLSESELTISVEGEAVVRGNAGLIRRALSNLLANAIKHTECHGSIRFGLRVEQGFGIVEVFNPGSPISDKIRARMFDRFFRADPARGQRGTSHGLGLAIVKAIAEMHGGQVVAKADTAGNTIGFKIPVSR